MRSASRPALMRNVSRVAHARSPHPYRAGGCRTCAAVRRLACSRSGRLATLPLGNARGHFLLLGGASSAGGHGHAAALKRSLRRKATIVVGAGRAVAAIAPPWYAATSLYFCSASSACANSSSFACNCLFGLSLRRLILRLGRLHTPVRVEPRRGRPCRVLRRLAIGVVPGEHFGIVVADHDAVTSAVRPCSVSGGLSAVLVKSTAAPLIALALRSRAGKWPGPQLEDAFGLWRADRRWRRR